MYTHMGCTNWIQGVKKVNKIIKKKDVKLWRRYGQGVLCEDGSEGWI